MSDLETFFDMYLNGLMNDKISSYVVKKYHNPYIKKMYANYEHNRATLLSYSLWKSDIFLPAFGELPLKALYDERGICSAINTDTGNMVSVKDVTVTENVTRPFFQELSNPLLIENEFNLYHYRYLELNVRKSEDYGGDNHIYMHYDDADTFYLMLQIMDISSVLSSEKFFFLIGDEKEKNYPYDFKKHNHIDYEKMKPTPVRIDEIQRIFLNWGVQPVCGFLFLAGIMDSHPNLVNIKNYGLGDFAYLYKHLLEGKTFHDVKHLLKDNKDSHIRHNMEFLTSPADAVSESCHVPKLDDLFFHLEQIFPRDMVPTAKEWLCGFHLAYAFALGRDLNQRIAPAIMFNPHSISTIENRDFLFEVYKDFPIFRGITTIRRLPNSLGAAARNYDEVLAHGLKDEYYVKGLLFPFYTFLKGHETDPEKSVFGGPYFVKSDDKWLAFRRVVRFEDLKLQPRAMLTSICEWLDIPWNDSLLSTTVNGTPQIARTYSAGTYEQGRISGFDTRPVYNRYEDYISDFDGYRLEILFQEIMKIYGYKFSYYRDGMKYTIDDITHMFRIKFKAESYGRKYNVDENVIEEIRKQILEMVRGYLVRDCKKSKDDEILVPIPRLMPKSDLIDGKVYE